MSMSLSAFKTTLKASFKALFTSSMGDVTLKAEQTTQIDKMAGEWADALAEDITDYIKTATVTINNASVTTYPVPTPGSGTIT